MSQYNKYIDHTLLKADAVKEDIEKLCEEAVEYDFKSVCVNSYWAPYCKSLLSGSDVEVCCVIGFPLGANSSASKAFEAKDAVSIGADEIDMVINIGELKANNLDIVISDIQEVKDAIGNKVLKVIIETALLSKEEIVRACEAIMATTADFVKTSTGFSTAGATLENVKLLKSVVKDDKLIKAAGGVKTPADLKEFIEAGANRIGTSSGVKLIQGDKAEGSY